MEEFGGLELPRSWQPGNRAGNCDRDRAGNCDREEGARDHV